MDNDMARVLYCLQHGADRAKTSRWLKEQTGLPNRDIRHAIRELIAEGYPVASSSDGWKGGYYIASTKEEAEGCMAETKSRIIELCIRQRDFKRATRSIREPGQLPLL